MSKESEKNNLYWIPSADGISADLCLGDECIGHMSADSDGLYCQVVFSWELPGDVDISDARKMFIKDVKDFLNKGIETNSLE